MIELTRFFAPALALLVTGVAVEPSSAASPFGSWRLQHTIANGKKIVPVPGSRITLKLQRNGRCNGNAGINNFFGECRVKVRNRRIAFPGPIGLTRKGGPPVFLRQESEFLMNLAESKRYRLRNGRFRLISGGRRVELHFRRDR